MGEGPTAKPDRWVLEHPDGSGEPVDRHSVLARDSAEHDYGARPGARAPSASSSRAGHWNRGRGHSRPALTTGDGEGEDARAHGFHRAACRRGACGLHRSVHGQHRRSGRARRRTVSLAACSAATSSVPSATKHAPTARSAGNTSFVHGELEPLRRERLVKDPLHHIDVHVAGRGHKGMRHKIRCTRRRVDRQIAQEDHRHRRPSPSERGRVTPDRWPGRSDAVCGLARPPALGRLDKGAHRRRGAR